jgi:hypothetical protein
VGRNLKYTPFASFVAFIGYSCANRAEKVRDKPFPTHSSTRADYMQILAYLRAPGPASAATAATATAARAKALRDEGNVFFMQQNYIPALVKYNDSIACLSDPTTLSNRCQCYLNMIKESRAKDEFNSARSRFIKDVRHLVTYMLFNLFADIH